MTRLTKEHRRAQLIHAARTIAFEEGLYQLSMTAVAKRAECTRSTVRHYFTSARKLRNLTLKNAIRNGEIGIVCMAIAMHDPMVNDISETLRNQCAAHIGER